MNTNKILMGGVAGGVAFFLLGWLIYGMMLMDYMKTHMNGCAMRPEAEWAWWALMLSCLMSGLLYAVIFDWANVRTVAAGAKSAAIVGLLIGLSKDLGSYSMSTMYSDMATIVVDLIACTVMAAIGGAVIGWVMGRGAAPAAA